jgi:hypothetical protein
MIERFSPDGRAAVEEIKAFIREAVPLDAIHERALLLAGLPADDIELGVAVFCHELAECFARERLPERFHIGFSIAAGDILQEKLVELQTKGIGRA